MPLIQANVVRVVVPVGDEDVIFVCRRPQGREISKFLSSRYVQKRNKVETRLYEARQDFARSIIIDAEGVTYKDGSGNEVPLNAKTVLTAEEKASWSAVLGGSVESWLDLISVTWLSSVAMHFEDSAPHAEGEAGN